MTQLILIRGLPGSGKSTIAGMFVQQFTYDTKKAYHLEADMAFVDDAGNYNFDRSKLYQAHMWCQNSTREHLAAGHTVIVSNTFTTRKELEPYFQIAADYGILPTVILAQSRWGNIHDVPPEVMVNMESRFEHSIKMVWDRYSHMLDGSRE